VWVAWNGDFDSPTPHLPQKMLQLRFIVSHFYDTFFDAEWLYLAFYEMLCIHEWLPEISFLEWVSELNESGFW